MICFWIGFYFYLSVRTLDYTDVDCLFVAVLSHGTKESFRTFDDDFEIERLISALTTISCPAMAAKPKILMFQHCRGDYRDSGTLMQRTPTPRSARSLVETDSVAIRVSETGFKIPMHSDIIQIYSTMPGKWIIMCSLFACFPA